MFDVSDTSDMSGKSDDSDRSEMTRTIGWLLIGVLIVLAAAECRRFARAGRAGSDELPYPRRRLVRRLAVGGLLAGCLALIMYWPRAHWGVQLACLGAVLAAMATGLALLWRDLYETSTDVVAHSQRMRREANESLRRWFEEHQATRKRKD